MDNWEASHALIIKSAYLCRFEIASAPLGAALLPNA